MCTIRYAFLAAMLALVPVTKAMASDSDDGSRGAAAPARHTMPSSLSSLAFPSAEWQRGSVAYPIGVPHLNASCPTEKVLACDALGMFSFRQRMGDAPRHVMHTLGMTHWVDQNPRIRPDVRYDKSYDVDAHDDGRKDRPTSAIVAPRFFITEVEPHDHPAA